MHDIQAETAEHSCARRYRSLSNSRAESIIHHLLSFTKNRIQMALAFETLRVDLINIFGTGRSRRKPTALRHNSQSADWGIVARGFGQLGSDRLARQVSFLYRVPSE